MIKFDNFIMEYEDFLPKHYCEDVMLYFNNMETSGYTAKRNNFDKHHIDDTQIALHDEHSIKFGNAGMISLAFLNTFWDIAYDSYVKKYSIISETEDHKIYNMKVQKTLIGEGYHRWHNETGSRVDSCRFLTFVAYLNDVEEGGETEFLYYPRRIKPKAGTLVLWPASFTHAHRGNPPISNEKYIITGWIEF